MSEFDKSLMQNGMYVVESSEQYPNEYYSSQVYDDNYYNYTQSNQNYAVDPMYQVEEINYGEYKYEQDDFDNMDAISREIFRSASYRTDDYDDDGDNDEDIGSPKDVGTNNLPVGAMPEQDGVLSPHAAEFWFPDCRSCPCCNGYRHGCKCRTPTVTQCQHPNCGNDTAPKPMVEKKPENVIPNVVNRSISNGGASNGSQKRSAYTPVGAMPEQNGVLSPHAAEFWFPDCRNCPCCNGYKHGCKCRSSTVTQCRDPLCGNPSIPSSTVTPAAVPPAAVPPPASMYSVTTDNTANYGFCKFESMPGGCRYGSSCRFTHSNPITPNNPYYDTPSVNKWNTNINKPLCTHFATGNCWNGDSCAYSH